MNITAFILFLFVLQGLCLFVSRKTAGALNTQEDYFLAGKSLRFFPLMMTFVATQVGGGLILGSAEEAYKFGWQVIFYPLGASLGLIFLGSGVGRRLSQFQVSTVAQILEVVYGSAVLKKMASILSMTSLFIILIGQIVASKKFMVALGVESPLLFIVFWGIVILYTAWGGLKAVVSTDLVQALFFFGAFVLVFGFAFSSAPSTFPVKETSFDWDTSRLLSWTLLPMLFMLIEQDMGQRCFAADSPKTVSSSAIAAAIITLLVSLIPIYFGCLAKTNNLNVLPGESVLMAAIKASTTPTLLALAGSAILAAIVSTADSLINAIGSNLAQDFNVKALQKVSLSQAISAAIATAAICFAFFSDQIVSMLMFSYELSVSCLFVPIFAALFFKRGGVAISAFAAIGGGLIGFFLFRWIELPFPREIGSVAFSALAFAIFECVAFKREAKILYYKK